MCTVMNLETAEKQIYTCLPEEAVVSAYAQEKGDFNTWEYKKYNNLLESGKFTFLCGNFSAFKDGRNF